MIKKFSVFLPVTTVFILAIGCTTVTGFVTPEVSLVDFRLGDVKILESSSIFTIRIDNENEYPLKINGGVYSIYVEGQKIGKGLSNSHLEIPPFSSVTDEVTVHSGNISLAFRIKSILENRKFDYKLKGKLLLDYTGHKNASYFVQDGHFDFEELQKGGNKK